MRVVEPGDRARLPLEPGTDLGVGREMGWQHLDCHIAAESGIVSLVHHAHAARTHFGQNLVMADLVARDCACWRHTAAVLRRANQLTSGGEMSKEESSGCDLDSHALPNTFEAGEVPRTRKYCHNTH